MAERSIQDDFLFLMIPVGPEARNCVSGSWGCSMVRSFIAIKWKKAGLSGDLEAYGSTHTCFW